MQETPPQSNEPESNSDAATETWLDTASQESDEAEVGEFDIVSSPNDWNFSTIVNFIESGAMKIPAFQRNYVWDIKRASKLIESLLIGLPVPQVFLYEEGRNSFLVIDGQQRLLTLYFYAKGRFPRPKVRGALRPTLGQGLINEEFLANDEFFDSFKLSLPKSPAGKKNRFHGLTYKALADDRTSLDLRTIRNIVVKQTSPEGDSAVFEIFNRLNTGGMNLSQQEIRASLYHSELFERVLEINLDDAWRRLVGSPLPDPRMRDTEFLLRGLALATNLDSFSGSLAGFINNFCLGAKRYTSDRTVESTDQLKDFIHIFSSANPETFMRSGKFSGVLFEAVFAAWSRLSAPPLSPEGIAEAVNSVKVSDEFAATLQEGSTKPVNIKGRVKLAESAIRKL